MKEHSQLDILAVWSLPPISGTISQIHQLLLTNILVIDLCVG